MLLDGENILEMDPSERAAAGLFLAFQYPIEIPGVATMTFLKAAMNAQRKARGEAELSTPDFMRAVKDAGRDAPHRSGHAEAGAQRRLLGRREEARRDPADGAAQAEDVRARRDRFRARHRCAEGRVGGRQRAARVRTARCWSSPTTSGCSTTSCPTACTSSRTAGSSRAATRTLALELESQGLCRVRRRGGGVGDERSHPRPARTRRAHADRAAAGAPAHGRGRAAGHGRPADAQGRGYHYTDLKLLLARCAGAGERRDDAASRRCAIAGAYRDFDRQRRGAAGCRGAGGRPSSGRPTASAITTRDDMLTRLNVALAKEALSLHIEGVVEQVIHIDRRIEGDAAHSPSAAGIFVADGATVTIVETYTTSDAAHVGNHSDAILAVGKGATVTHVAVDLSAPEATHLRRRTSITVGEGAQLRIAGGPGRVGAEPDARSFARFDGRGRARRLHRAQSRRARASTRHHAGGEPRGAAAPAASRSTSRSRAGARKAVFQGKIVVERDAQKTDAKMMMQGLMLSDEAEILSKPELEIFADDVVCGHGSTCGALDETSLFYLMSRGIPKAEAESDAGARASSPSCIDPIEDRSAARASLDGVIETLARGAKMTFDLAKVRADFPILDGRDPRAPAGLSRLRRVGAEAGAGARPAWTRRTGTTTPTSTAGCTRSPTARPRPTRTAREKVARFLNAARPEEIIFTRSATEAINLVASSFAGPRIGEGDEIVAHGDGAPLQHRAVALPPRAQGRGAEVGRRPRRRQLRPRRVRGGAVDRGPRWSRSRTCRTCWAR